MIRLTNLFTRHLRAVVQQRSAPLKVVFLHIPKTAGQTIHNELVGLVGPENVSPVRVHTQASEGAQMPHGFQLYSGHIDWLELENIDAPTFTFSVLRDPRARIASFYFYLLREAGRLSAEELARPENIGKYRILEWSADSYFFGGDVQWQTFIRDYYDNFYTGYFATRRMRGRQALEKITVQAQLVKAKEGIACLNGLYHTDNLSALEKDLERRFGKPLNLVGNYVNAGRGQAGGDRWMQLLDRLERPENREKLETFVHKDEILLSQLRASNIL